MKLSNRFSIFTTFIFLLTIAGAGVPNARADLDYEDDDISSSTSFADSGYSCWASDTDLANFEVSWAAFNITENYSPTIATDALQDPEPIPLGGGDGG